MFPALIDMSDTEAFHSQCDGRGAPSGNYSGFNAGSLNKFDPVAITRMEPLEFISCRRKK
jgi:hypothetical protein